MWWNFYKVETTCKVKQFRFSDEKVKKWTFPTERDTCLLSVKTSSSWAPHAYIPPLRGWWIHSARFPSLFCCYSFWVGLFLSPHWEGRLFFFFSLFRFAFLPRPPQIKLSSNLRLKPEPLPSNSETLIICLVLYLIKVVKKGDRLWAACLSQLSNIPSAFTGKLFRRASLVAVSPLKWNTV